MEPPRDAFSIAVAEIRARMRSGRLVQGEQLMVTQLSRDLKLSATPVREALARLAGEGLIEDRRGAGYFAWRLDAVDLIELYDLQCALLRAAADPEAGLGLPPLQEAGSVPAAEPAPDADQARVSAVERLLLGLVRRGRSLALLQAQGRLADRLAPPRRVEADVLADFAGEWLALLTIMSGGDDQGLQVWISTYRDRRHRAAAAIVAAMRSAAVRRI